MLNDVLVHLANWSPMLLHVSPVIREGVPNLGCALHNESPGDGRSVDPLLVLIKNLECLDPGFLP